MSAGFSTTSAYRRLWASSTIFYAVRAATLALRYPALERAFFGKAV
jgi:hypothetical protein